MQTKFLSLRLKGENCNQIGIYKHYNLCIQFPTNIKIKFAHTPLDYDLTPAERII